MISVLARKRHIQKDFVAQSMAGCCQAFSPPSTQDSWGAAEFRLRKGGISMGFDRSMGSTPHAMFAVLRHRACGNGPTVDLSVPQGHQAIEDYRAHRIERCLRLGTRTLAADHLFAHRYRSLEGSLVTLLLQKASSTASWGSGGSN